MRRRFLVVAVAALISVAGVRLAIHPTLVGGYHQIDDYNIALQVLGASPTWRAITAQTETPSEVTVGVSEIGMLQFGAGLGDERIGYIVVTLREPLAGRQVVDATTGNPIPRISQ